MKYIELGVKVNSLWAEYVSEILINKVKCSGVVTEEIRYKDEAVIAASQDIAKGYLWYDEKNFPDMEEIQHILYREKADLTNKGINEDSLGSWEISIKKLEDEDWAHSWKKFWHPQKIGKRIIICPSWEQCEVKGDEIKIELDPGTAFGTGTHPTTRLCIRALEKYVKEGDKIADIGTGSGILAVSAVKLGAEEAVGVDNDPSVIDVAKENALKNGVDDKCIFYTGSASDIKGEFNIVVANILAEINAQLMPDLTLLAGKESKLILSGIIKEKSDLVKQAALEQNLEITEVMEEEGWVAIIANKK